MILWQKNKSKCGLSWSVLLSTMSTRHNSFPKHIFVLSLHVKRVWESSWNERLTRTSSSVCTFKSESVFSIFNKSFQRFLSLSLILWWKKKQFECRLVWHWWNSTDLGLIDMFLCRNCCLYIIILNFVTFIDFLTVFFEITYWSVGRPVTPIRFSGPRRTRWKSSRYVWWCCYEFYWGFPSSYIMWVLLSKAKKVQL